MRDVGGGCAPPVCGRGKRFNISGEWISKKKNAEQHTHRHNIIYIIKPPGECVSHFLSKTKCIYITEALLLCMCVFDFVVFCFKRARTLCNIHIIYTYIIYIIYIPGGSERESNTPLSKLRQNALYTTNMCVFHTFIYNTFPNVFLICFGNNCFPDILRFFSSAPIVVTRARLGLRLNWRENAATKTLSAAKNAFRITFSPQRSDSKQDIIRYYCWNTRFKYIFVLFNKRDPKKYIALTTRYLSSLKKTKQ